MTIISIFGKNTAQSRPEYIRLLEVIGLKSDLHYSQILYFCATFVYIVLLFY